MSREFRGNRDIDLYEREIDKWEMGKFPIKQSKINHSQFNIRLSKLSPLSAYTSTSLLNSGVQIS